MGIRWRRISAGSRQEGQSTYEAREIPPGLGLLLRSLNVRNRPEAAIGTSRRRVFNACHSQGKRLPHLRHGAFAARADGIRLGCIEYLNRCTVKDLEGQ